MEIVKQHVEDEMLSKFIKKHGLKEVQTSPMEYNQYTKRYIGERDNAVFTEINRKVVEDAKATVVVKGIEVVIVQEIALFETEFFSTDDSTSRYIYQRY